MQRNPDRKIRTDQMLTENQKTALTMAAKAVCVSEIDKQIEGILDQAHTMLTPSPEGRALKAKYQRLLAHRDGLQ